jgi:Putative restriction endonuclease
MSAPAAPVTRIPPLRNGDKLDRHEFERRYNAMPGVNKAELIDGVVYMPSPVSFEDHAEHQAFLIAWMIQYRYQTPGVRVGDNATVRLDLGNAPQPDGLLLIDPKHGGQVTFENGYVKAGPELAAEVAASSVSIDANSKLHAYQQNGVSEYLLWRVEDEVIDWFALRSGQYVPLPVGAEGIVRSEVFPGLWLDSRALMTHDFARVLAVLQEGLATAEHAAFVERLRRAATP